MKKDLVPAFVAFLAIAAVCFGISAARPPVAPPLSKPVKASKAPAADDRVVMRVNGEPVTEREFSAFVAQAPEQMQYFYASPEGRRILADELVKLKALEQEGRRLGVENQPDVATQLEIMETNLVAGSALRQIIGPPSEERLRAEYEKQKSQFESTDLSHILIAFRGSAVPPRSGPPLSEGEALQRAQQMAARIRSGADFGAMARAESDDLQSAPNGGSLGTIQPGSLPPDIQKVTARLAAGEVSAPVRTEFGVHLFKAGERKVQAYAEVRGALASRVQRDDAAAAMERLHKTAKVELDPKYFAQSKQPSRGPAASPPRPGN